MFLLAELCLGPGPGASVLTMQGWLEQTWPEQAVSHCQVRSWALPVASVGLVRDLESHVMLELATSATNAVSDNKKWTFLPL